jgi:hypothetical protein
MQVRAADGRFHHLDDSISCGPYFRLGTIIERFVAGSMVDKRFHGMFRSKGLLGVNESSSAAPHLDFDQGRPFGLARCQLCRNGASPDIVVRRRTRLSYPAAFDA